MLEQILREIERNGFGLIPNLVSATDLAEMNRFFIDHRGEFTPAMVGSKDQKQRVEAVRGDFTYWIDALDPVKPFDKLVGFLDQLRSSVNEKFFLGLQQYECHLAYYPPGTFYKKHLDRHESNSSRSLSFVFYLNETVGGELVLYNKDNEIIKTVTPTPGTFICFMSDEFPHEVKPSEQERRTFTGWMHTKIIY
jgi:SM-20-related protein